jgi:microsomal dipeptidase-like Zn-dependent dipeptidase
MMKNITKELIRRGYSRDDIAKIWGGNFMRVMNEVQALSVRQ